MGEAQEPRKADEGQSRLNAELDALNGFQLRAEVIRREAECKRLRNALAEKEDIFLRLLSLKEELNTKTYECEKLKRKIKKVEDEARNVLKAPNVK